MTIGVLTSSRADYGIYQPLLAQLKTDKSITLEIIAFGMHLQTTQGNTISIIEKDDYSTIHRVGSMPDRDDVLDIAMGYASITEAFAHFWNQHNYDVVFALGDRWEMSAAVQASIPFQIKLAHIHGGETTLGAIDNIYRHQITLTSAFHFTAAEDFSNRVRQIIGSNQDVVTTGSISLEGIKEIELPEWATVQDQFEIPFERFVLVTVHPESVLVEKNREFAAIISDVLSELIRNEMNLLITKSNSDALGSIYNEQFQKLEVTTPTRVKLVDALGKYNYFKAMHQSLFMLGNTSSGIIEAASFNKWVINLGERQRGRLRNDNVLDVPFNKSEILRVVEKVANLAPFEGNNKYSQADTCRIIISYIKKNAKL